MISQIYFTIQSFNRYFTLKFGSYLIQDEYRDALERLLHNLKVYEEDPNGNKKEPYKLYHHHELIWYIPSIYLGEVFLLLKNKHPEREKYQLINLHKHNSAGMELKIKPSYKLRDYQQEYHDLIVNGKEDRIFVDLRTGTGKASWNKSRVLTYYGYVKLEDLRVGDIIIGLNRETRVKAIHPQGVKKLYKIRLNGDEEHICTEDHHWEVRVGIKEVYKVVNTKQLMGYLRHNVMVQIPTIIPKAYHDFGKKGILTVRKEYDVIDYDNNDEALSFAIDSVRNFLLYVESDDEKHRSLKKIMEMLVLFPIKVRFVVLIFLLEDDMTTITKIRDGHYEAVMRFLCADVAEAMRDMFYSVSLRASLVKVGETYELTFRIKGVNEELLKEDGVTIAMVITDTLSTMIDTYNDGFKMSKNQTNLVRYSPIKDITYFGEDEATCIEVTDPNALYVVDDFMLTHNSFISTCAVVTRAKRTGFILLPRYIDKWEEDFLEYTNIKKERIYKVKGRESIEDLLRFDNYKKYDVILFSIRTLYNLWKEYERGDKSISPIMLFNQLEIGTLVSDESHQELNAVFKILTYSNVEKIIGMSATYISSKASERRIQELLFPYNTRASNLVEFDNYIQYFDCPYSLDTLGGVIKHKSFQGYSQIVFETSILKNVRMMYNYFEMIYQLFEMDFFQRREKGDKALVYFGLVAMCSNFTEFLKSKEEVKKLKLDVRKYTQEDDYETIKVADVIISTLQSLSTAFTVPSLVAVYNTVSVRSPKANLQSMGRLRKLQGKATKFYNVYARNLPPHKVNAKNRVEQSRKFVKSIGRIDLGFVSKF